MPSETYAKTFKDSIMSRLRYGKVERLEYGGRALNNTATEIFIEGKSNQRIYFPFNTVAYIHVAGAYRDNAVSPNAIPFRGELRVVRNASGAVTIIGTGAANAALFTTPDNAATAVTALAVSVANNEEIKFTFTGAASSGINLIRFRLNIVSVSTDSDVIVN